MDPTAALLQEVLLGSGVLPVNNSIAGEESEADSDEIISLIVIFKASHSAVIFFLLNSIVYYFFLHYLLAGGRLRVFLPGCYFAVAQVILTYGSC